jgi:hypothetical protein
VRGGVAMSLLTFEPEARHLDDGVARANLKREGIDWHMLRYHKRSDAAGHAVRHHGRRWRASRIVRRQRIDLLHARSHVGAAIGALAKEAHRRAAHLRHPRLSAEEYVDSGNWPKDGVLFRLTKAVERWLYRSADAFVVLTERARETLFPATARTGKTVAVIPCCVTAGTHRTAERSRRRAQGPRRIRSRRLRVHRSAQRLLPPPRDGRVSGRSA